MGQRSPLYFPLCHIFANPEKKIKDVKGLTQLEYVTLM